MFQIPLSEAGNPKVTIVFFSLGLGTALLARWFAHNPKLSLSQQTTAKMGEILAWLGFLTINFFNILCALVNNSLTNEEVFLTLGISALGTTIAAMRKPDSPRD